MVTQETAILYIGYYHKELVDFLFFECKKKSLLPSLVIENLPLTTLIDKMLIKINMPTVMNIVANMLEMHNIIYECVVVDKHNIFQIS